MRGKASFQRLLRELPAGSRVLDLGSGAGLHAVQMRKHRLAPITISLVPPADIVGDFLSADIPPINAIWASHVLEHQPDPGAFLRRCFDLLPEGGYLSIIVPHDRRDMAGGHVISWSEGLLIYHLLLAGFDCRNASVGFDRKQLCVVLRKHPLPPIDLIMDRGDLEKLAPFFPWKNVRHKASAFMGPVNWRIDQSFAPAGA